jgi:hypothetical protein
MITYSLMPMSESTFGPSGYQGTLIKKDQFYCAALFPQPPKIRCPLM